MRRSRRARKWLYLAVALAAVMASSALHPALLETRDTWSRTAVVQSFPPSLVLSTQMLGSFRGMLIVGLWLRATALQEQRRYYELVQLFDWITQLEPGLESVWTFAAWNMAYNISVSFRLHDDNWSGHEERWRWVRKGLEVLLYRGMQYNPRSYVLNRELAYVYLHKVASMSDEAHWYYKLQMAKHLHPILGGPEPDYARLAAAPRTAGKLLEDEAVRTLVEQARRAGFDPLKADITWLNNPETLPEAVAPILAPAEPTPAHEALEAFLRARALYEGWRIDAAVAKELVDKYGPLDFRQPEAHALYWASQSLNYVKPTESRIHGERMIYDSLVQISEIGRLTYLPDSDRIDRSPDLRFVDAGLDAFKRLLAMPELGPGAKKSTRSAYRYWLRNMIALLYARGSRQKATELLDTLYELEPRPEHMGPVGAFVVREIEEDITQGQHEQVAGYVRALIERYYYWLALDDQEVAEGYLAMAKVVYALAMQRAPERYHVLLGPWNGLLDQVLKELLDPEHGYPEALRELLRERLGLPPEEGEPETEEAASRSGRP